MKAYGGCECQRRGADERDRLRREGGRAGDKKDACSKPVERLQLKGDVRIDDALVIEVSEQNERAATGRRLRRELLVGIAKEPESVAV